MEKWKRVEKNWRWPTTPETPAQFLYLDSQDEISSTRRQNPSELLIASVGKGA